mgnify:CR=1 FL=1
MVLMIDLVVDKGVRAMGRKKGTRLTRETILAEAMKVVDEEGLSGLSVRKLGGKLGVQGMALYYHFTSKTAIIDELVAELMSHVDLAFEEADWVERLRRIHESQRRVLLGHPNLLPAVISRPFNTPASVRVTDVVLEVLLAAGFDDKAALHACQTLRAYVLGYTVTETVGLLGDPPRWDNRDRMDLPDYVEHGFTHLLQVAPAAEEIDHDEEFAAGLSAILSGLKGRVAGDVAGTGAPVGDVAETGAPVGVVETGAPAGVVETGAPAGVVERPGGAPGRSGSLPRGDSGCSGEPSVSRGAEPLSQPVSSGRTVA